MDSHADIRPITSRSSGIPFFQLNRSHAYRIYEGRQGERDAEQATSQMESTCPADERIPAPAPTDGAAHLNALIPARHSLVRLAYRLLWNREDAEDAVQSALATAEAKRSELREKDKWFAWVRQIVVQQCRSMGRKRLLWKRFQQSAQPNVARIAFGGHEASESAAIIQRLLVELPERQRQVISLRFLDGLPYDEIAEILGVASTTCRVHAHAGLETMRAAMMRRHPNFIDE